MLFRGQDTSRIWQSFALRLSLWFAVAFTVSAAVLFALLYFLLGSFFEQSEREIIEARLKECAAVYETRGLPALSALVHRTDFGHNEGPFFVRVTGPERSVMLLVAPEEWLREPGTPVDQDDPNQQAWLQIPKDERSEFIIAKTVRGKGLPSIENGADRWFCSFTEQEAMQLLNELHGQKEAVLESETLIVR